MSPFLYKYTQSSNRTAFARTQKRSLDSIVHIESLERIASLLIILLWWWLLFSITIFSATEDNYYDDRFLDAFLITHPTWFSHLAHHSLSWVIIFFFSFDTQEKQKETNHMKLIRTLCVCWCQDISNEYFIRFLWCEFCACDLHPAHYIIIGPSHLIVAH